MKIKNQKNATSSSEKLKSFFWNKWRWEEDGEVELERWREVPTVRVPVRSKLICPTEPWKGSGPHDDTAQGITAQPGAGTKGPWAETQEWWVIPSACHMEAWWSLQREIVNATKELIGKSGQMRWLRTPGKSCVLLIKCSMCLAQWWTIFTQS